MRKALLATIVFYLFSASINYAQTSGTDKGLQAITGDAIKAQLDFLASDWTEGREAGEKGEYLASDYIASMLRLYGVKPGGDYQDVRSAKNVMEGPSRTYFQNFILIKTLPVDVPTFEIRSKDGETVRSSIFTNNVDFTVRPSDQAVEIEAPVIFAGYGYKNDSMNYDDLKKLNLKGKFILKISGVPKFIRESIGERDFSSAMAAMESRFRALGAIGIIEFNPENTVAGRPERKEFMNMSPSEGKPRSGKPIAWYSVPGKKNPENFMRVTVSAKTANEILNGTGIDPDEYVDKADRNEKYQIPAINGKYVFLKTSVKTSQIAVRNILGIIEGKNPDEFIVLGAHYDHLGQGNGFIWNGADDNGSGTVGVMTLAKAIMATGEKPEKSVIIALWTAEEEGLLGSRYYIRNPTVPLTEIKLNVNFDMISRYISDDDPKRVTMTYNISCPGFKDMTARNIDKYSIGLNVDFQPSADPPGGTDHRSFVEAGIPIMRFKPGHRMEYHTPSDETGTIDWDIMEKIIRISFANVWELANTSWQSDNKNK